MKARLAGVLLFLLLAAPATAGAASWRPLPPAPIRVDAGLASAWTGKEMLVFGRDQQTALDARGKPYAPWLPTRAAHFPGTARGWSWAKAPVCS